MGATNAGRVLFAFDFDHTCINDNSDTRILDVLLPEALPDELRRSYVKG